MSAKTRATMFFAVTDTGNTHMVCPACLPRALAAADRLLAECVAEDSDTCWYCTRTATDART